MSRTFVLTPLFPRSPFSLLFVPPTTLNVWLEMNHRSYWLVTRVSLQKSPRNTYYVESCLIDHLPSFLTGWSKREDNQVTSEDPEIEKVWRVNVYIPTEYRVVVVLLKPHPPFPRHRNRTLFDETRHGYSTIVSTIRSSRERLHQSSSLLVHWFSGSLSTQVLLDSPTYFPQNIS